ncbi:MAG: hypothetical protein K5779_02115 [Saccharofermentans sp.]|nr:hypothetical protein [Saccharofermentans sp.]
MKIKREITAVLIAASMIFAFCGCGKGKKTEAAKNYCISFCEDVKNGDADRLASYYADPSVTAESLKEIISPSSFNSEEAAFSDTVKASLRYNVQEPVYDSRTKSATVYVSWGQADYSCEEALNAGTVTTFKTSMSSAPEKIITTCVTIDMSGDILWITNPDDILNEVYAFNSEDHGIMKGLLSDYYTGGDLVLAPKGTYSNTDSIGVRLNFNKDLLNNRFVPGVIYTVARDDEVIYTSGVVYIGEDGIRLDLTSDMTGKEGLNEDGFLLAGNYTFMVFDEHSKEIARFDCVVENVKLEKETFEFEDHKEDYYLSNLVYEFKDSDLMGEAYVFNSGWWDYDGTSVGKSAFASNTSVIGFSLAVSTKNETELYYEYFYSEESDFADLDVNAPVYQGSCIPSLYEDQACYDLDYPSKDLKPGFYGLVVYGDAAKKHVVMTAACIVVEETSDDLN